MDKLQSVADMCVCVLALFVFKMYTILAPVRFLYVLQLRVAMSLL